MTNTTPYPSPARHITLLIDGWDPRTEGERVAHASFRSHFSGELIPMHRDTAPDHATASALVFSPDLSRTLLVFHGKGQFWVQPGGHIEGHDASIVDAALRELEEETSTDRASVQLPGAYDLDHHTLGNRFGACASHLDVGIAVLADPRAAVAVSDESEEVRWFRVNALPDALANGAERRILAMQERVRNS
ncbi:NUDIX hydrolase [Microbacterium suaedae]|uniref:NUDIX hydrolase n=1 Tax=Microbacterium suaedae TaxID=2067813 RepID=UPI000DA23268|nr:NUDIX domain-containing protein [Microbacterium suaedae]